MSAILAALANPAVDALAAQLISQGITYFQSMAARKQEGLMTEADVLEMAKKLDVNYDALLEARQNQQERERLGRDAAQQQLGVPDSSSTSAQDETADNAAKAEPPASGNVPTSFAAGKPTNRKK